MEYEYANIRVFYVNSVIMAKKDSVKHSSVH
jgi:hypothetical protein